SKEKRGAQFVCQISMFDENGKYYTVKGEVRGYILEQLSGEGGFGYDPLFFYEPLNKTFGMLNPEEKNEISHRGKALKELKSIISETIK
ncbi:MAG: non-canonical purine NTP pyrophosphatase, partial [Clostridium butyricum]|nr:non-canonical purine NTP pyrophosphatase [Clostridium butyricum]